MRLALTLVLLSSVARADVWTQHNDNSRTGAALDETWLTNKNVDGARFGKLFTRTVVGDLYAQPLYVAGLTINAAGHNVVFLASMHNVVYAFDADDPAASTELWSTTLETPAPLPDANIGASCGTYRDIRNEIGIVSTPVIDVARQLLYVVTFSHVGSVYSHHLHALSLLDGSEQLSGPITIGATIAGTGSGNVSGQIAFQSEYQNQRPALTHANGQIYVGFAAYCDSGPYHGWAFAYDDTSLSQTAVFNATPDGSEGGIWQGGEGFSVDGNGKIYLVSANGSFNYSTGGNNLGEGFRRMSAALAVEDYFTPYNFTTLTALDNGDSSTGLLLIPGSTRILGGSKSGWLYLTDTTDLGQVGATNNNQIAQSFQLTSGGGIYGSPVYWNGKVYIWGVNDSLKAFPFDGEKLVSPPPQVNAITPAAMPGGVMSISANNNLTGSGVLWSNMSSAGSANQAVVPGILRAFDAGDITKQLWTSDENSSRDGLGNLAKFSAPTIADGKVYLSTFSNQLVVYGLLPKALELVASPSPAPYGQTISVTATVIGPDHGMPTGQVSFFDGVSALGPSTLDGNGQARWSGLLEVGTHSLTATYPGDGNFAAVASSPVPETITQLSSTTTLASSPAPATFGDALTLTATVTSGATGMVSFNDGATALGTVSLVGNQASLTLSTLSLGTHMMVAVYSGDTHYVGSTSATFAQMIVGGTVTLSANPSPVPFGGSAILDVTATAAGGILTGTITFDEGATQLGAQALDATDHAVLVTPGGATGTHSIIATYSGDANFPAADFTFTYLVTTAPSAVSLGAQQLGEAWLLGTQVSGGGLGTPSGSVTFSDGNSTLGSATLDEMGGAVLQVTLAVGTHSLVAHYGGDADFAAADSLPITLTITPVPAVDAGSDASGPNLTAGGGCACDLAQHDNHSGWLAALSLMMMLAFTRRRRRAR